MIHTIEQAKRRNEAAGQFFFARSTMRFFGSRISERTYPLPYGMLFVTSEVNSDGVDRRYTVRYISDDGHTSTRGGHEGFRRWRTARQAHRYALRCQRIIRAYSAHIETEV